MTNKVNLVSNIIETINQLLVANNQPKICMSSLSFVFSYDVVYGKKMIFNITYNYDEVLNLIEDKVSGGPSWIHANLVRSSIGNFVILEFGALVGNPWPSINVSFEDSEAELLKK